MRDYWRQCGYRLLERTGEGHLVVTDDFLRSLLERPELAPVPNPAPPKSRCTSACSPNRAQKSTRAARGHRR